MAKILKSFEFKDGNGRYPWDAWLDGRIRLLTRNVDFTVDREVIRVLVHKAAHTRGCTVRVNSVKNGIVIKAERNGRVKKGKKCNH